MYRIYRDLNYSLQMSYLQDKYNLITITKSLILILSSLKSFIFILIFNIISVEGLDFGKENVFFFILNNQTPHI
jgi:hypothetical protein